MRHERLWIYQNNGWRDDFSRLSLDRRGIFQQRSEPHCQNHASNSTEEKSETSDPAKYVARLQSFGLWKRNTEQQKPSSREQTRNIDMNICKTVNKINNSKQVHYCSTLTWHSYKSFDTWVTSYRCDLTSVDGGASPSLCFTCFKGANKI